MANVLGAITTSHVPAIGGAIAKGLQQDPYFKPFFDGFPPVHAWLAKARPDVVVVFHGDFSGTSAVAIAPLLVGSRRGERRVGRLGDRLFHDPAIE